MRSFLDRVSRACVPLAALPLLAALRDRASLRGTVRGDRLWLSWAEGDEEVLRHVLPIRGAELYTRDNGLWYRPGRRLPELGLPPEQGEHPLDALVAPAPCRPEGPDRVPLVPVALRLVRDGRVRAPSASVVSLEALRGWAGSATTWQLERLEAAWCEDRVVLRGAPLPVVPGTRYCGRTVLVPLGYRTEPDWPERALSGALGLAQSETALLHLEGGVDVLGAEAFGPVSRAGIRRAAGGERP